MAKWVDIVFTVDTLGGVRNTASNGSPDPLMASRSPHGEVEREWGKVAHCAVYKYICSA